MSRAMEPDPERLGGDTDDRRGFVWLEPEDVDDHERLAIGDTERGERSLEVDAHVGAVTSRRHVRQRLGALEEPCSGRFEEHATRDPEQPGLDGGVASEPERCGTGADEGLLRELLRVLRVPDDPEEVREDGLLMGPEDILKLQRTLDGRSR